MAVSRSTVWVANDILTAAALNGEFDLFVGSDGQDVSFPRTEAADFDGYTLILDGAGTTTLRADTADEIDIAIAGSDIYNFTATELTILGKRVLTTVDRSVLRRELGGLLMRAGTTEARVAELGASGYLASQLNNF